LRRRWRHAPAVALRLCPLPVRVAAFRPQQIEQRLPVLGDEGVEKDQAREAVGCLFRDPGDDHPAVAVAYQDHPGQILAR
jgi:hypothetical protein